MQPNAEGPGGENESRPTRPLHLALLAALSILAFLAVGESLARVSGWMGLVALTTPKTVRDVWAQEGWIVDRDLHWARQRGYRGQVKDWKFKTNSRGLRGPEVAVPKPPDVYRILTIGDSTVFGFRVSAEKSFSGQIEQILKKRYPARRFDVVNAGIQGYSLYNSFVYLKRDGFQFEPDLIVVQSNFNDRRYVLSERYEDSAAFYSRFYYRLRLREALYHSHLYLGLRTLLVDRLHLAGSDLVDTGKFDFQNIDLEDLHCRVDPSRYEAMLGELIDTALERDIPVALIPLRDPPSFVDSFYRADEFHANGTDEDALRILFKMMKTDFYPIIAARRINAIWETRGHPDQKLRQIPLPLGWMDTDGNVPIYLSDPYTEIMDRAATRDGVSLVDFEPRSYREVELYLDYIHLNELGHRLLAEKLADTLAESTELRFAR